MAVIYHLDADSFFASCEQSIHPHLKGRPVMTGAERGIVAAASYEAKRRGIVRGMRVHEARQCCPGIVVLPSDYEVYSMFSLRMFEILRTFSPCVETYSIDEGFLDMTGMHKVFKCSHHELALRIQATIRRELDIGVSIGVSVSKVLAKLGSKHNKPQGVTCVPRARIDEFTRLKGVGDVWGIGKRTTDKLQGMNVLTAHDYAHKPESWILKKFTKPQWEIWNELNGRSVFPVISETRAPVHSIAKCKTFTPPSSNREFVFAQLAKNLEGACINARRHDMVASGCVIVLRTGDFNETYAEVRFENPTSDALAMIKAVKAGFDSMFVRWHNYRLTGAILTGIRPRTSITRSLFDDAYELEKRAVLQQTVDGIATRWGRHALCLGASLPAFTTNQHAGERGTPTWRQSNLLPNEDSRRHVGLMVTDYGI